MSDEDGDAGSTAPGRPTPDTSPGRPGPDESPTESLDLGALRGPPAAPEPAAGAEPQANEDPTRVIPAVASPAPPPPGETARIPSGTTAPPPVAAPPDDDRAQAPETPSARPPWVRIAAIAGGVFAVLGIAYAADLAVSSGKVPRGVTVAGIEVGGSSRAEAEATLQAQLGPRTDQPVPVQAGDVSAEIVPSAAGLAVDWEATLDRADAQPLNPFTRLTSFFTTDEIGVASTRDEAALAAAVEGLRAQTDRATREGNVVFEGATPVPVSPTAGQNLNGEGAEAALTEKWAFGLPIELPVEVVPVSVSEESVQRALTDVAVPAASADLVVTGRNGVVATAPRQQIGAILAFEPDGNGGLKPVYNFEAATAILAPQLVSTEIMPKDADITLEGGSPVVVPAVVGDLVQWPKTLENLPQLLATTGSHTTAAVYGPVPPALTTDAAGALGVKEVIGEFTTGGFSAASGTNIRLAASEINGALIKPGETFSLNGYTGPRGAAQGYVESGIINNGRPDKAIGGGVSQVATTLYNAAYFAGMEDVAHTEHSYYISRYPEAREATVFEGAIDLQFRNPTDTGVLIQAIGGSSELTIRFWGTKTVQVQSITGNRTNFTQPDTITLPAGEGCVPSSGAQGFTTSDTRVITDTATGREISRNTRTVRYDPVPNVTCVAPAQSEQADRAPAPEAPAPAPAPAPPQSPEPPTPASGDGQDE
ncbi:MAG: VanW family protein [Rhodococcus sp. (in: high G+C Gram-positive bacteria)]|uniref:VanW family protein n=1 Tax=Rhodococcus sp. TaxID=1831 RepID=UPI003BAF3455